MFSERLKNARIAKGLTQKAVADYLGIIPHAYQKYEYGEREPSFDMLVKLADLLQVSTDFLLCRSDDATPPKR